MINYDVNFQRQKISWLQIDFIPDRFLPITSGSEARDKMQWLLNRLCLLIHEDGRLPQVCKVQHFSINSLVRCTTELIMMWYSNFPSKSYQPPSETPDEKSIALELTNF